ncbi:MAG: hypothetical protein AAF449_09510, partial [Myxococcota bacterium]
DRRPCPRNYTNTYDSVCGPSVGDGCVDSNTCWARYRHLNSGCPSGKDDYRRSIHKDGTTQR